MNGAESGSEIYTMQVLWTQTRGSLDATTEAVLA